jgi:hypothetical protein
MNQLNGHDDFAIKQYANAEKINKKFLLVSSVGGMEIVNHKVFYFVKAGCSLACGVEIRLIDNRRFRSCP